MNKSQNIFNSTSTSAMGMTTGSSNNIFQQNNSSTTNIFQNNQSQSQIATTNPYSNGIFSNKTT